jgi:hypothetical protein
MLLRYCFEEHNITIWWPSESLSSFYALSSDFHNSAHDQSSAKPAAWWSAQAQRFPCGLRTLVLYQVTLNRTHLCQPTSASRRHDYGKCHTALADTLPMLQAARPATTCTPTASIYVFTASVSRFQGCSWNLQITNKQSKPSRQCLQYAVARSSNEFLLS